MGATRVRPRDVVALVESPFTGAGTDAARVLAEDGVTPVVLLRDPEGLVPYLVEQYADIGAELRRVDTTSTEAVLAACEEIARRDRLIGVTSVYEYFVQRAAEVAARLGLPGPDPHAVASCRSKADARAVLATVPGLNPAWAVCESAAQVGRAVERIGGPVVVKPTAMTGSVHVKRCEEAAEAASFAEGVLAVDEYLGLPVEPRVLVEAWVPGEEFSAEAVDGQVVGVTRKRCGPPPFFIEMGHVFPAPIPAAASQLVTCTAEQALRALGLTWGPAHVEVKLAAEAREARIIEVNARLAGDRIPELVRLASGVDMVRLQMDAVRGRPRRIEPSRGETAVIEFSLGADHARLVAIEGIEDATACPGVREVQARIHPGHLQIANGSNQDRAMWCIAVGADEAQATARARDALDRVRLVWEEPVGADAKT